MVEQLTKALSRATHIAEHLFQMIDRETWRATGGDDGQGHYEGDYRAESVLQEIRELAALASLEEWEVADPEHDWCLPEGNDKT